MIHEMEHGEHSREAKTATPLSGQHVALGESRTRGMIGEQHKLKAARAGSKTLQLRHARSLRLRRLHP